MKPDNPAARETYAGYGCCSISNYEASNYSCKWILNFIFCQTKIFWKIQVKNILLKLYMTENSSHGQFKNRPFISLLLILINTSAS